MRLAHFQPIRTKSRRPAPAVKLALMLTLASTRLSVGCSDKPTVPDPHPAQAALAAFKLESTAFKPGGEIPRKFTCEGEDASPALTWTDPPAGTQSFALIVDDPDAPVGTFTHWLIYDLPASARQLAEAAPKDAAITGGTRQGRNDFEKIGYNGPCPPPGKFHRYNFKLYALDKKLDLRPGAAKKEVEEAMKGHILANVELTGRYRR